MTVIYRPLATSKFRTHNALSAFKRLSSEDDVYYLTLGQLTAWSGSENDNLFRPPFPVDDPDIFQDYWSNIMGYIKIDKNSVRFVTDRNDWGDPSKVNSKTYNVGDIICTGTLDGVNTDISQRAGIMVYRCLSVPATSPRTAGTDFPVGEDTLIDTGDNYTWEYLYTIPEDEIIKFCTKEYITVPGPAQLEDLSYYGRENVSSTVFDKTRLVYELGATKLMYYTLIEDTYFTEMITAGNVENTAFRQITIIVNPYTYTLALDYRDLSGDPVYFNETGDGGASINNWKIIAEKASAQIYDRAEILQETGEMIYVENRAPIYRSFNQLEEIRIVLSY